MRQSLFAYTYTHCAHGVLRVLVRRKGAGYACHKNLSAPATIIGWLFVHFLTRKHTASVGIRHAYLNISVGLSDAYTTPSLLLCMFPCCKSRQNISSRSCHSALWVGAASRIRGWDPRMHVYSYTHACYFLYGNGNIHAWLTQWWNTFYFNEPRL